MNSEAEVSWLEIRQFVDEILFQSTQKYLNDVEIAVFKGCWEGKKYEDIAIALNLSSKYIQNDLGAKLWHKLTEALGYQVSKSNFRQSLLREREKRKSVLRTISVNQLESPHYPVPLDSHFYIERYGNESLGRTLESLCYEVIKQPAALIRIKAPRQMGKTSLLDRILAQAHNYNYQIVRLNFQDVDKIKFESLNTFLYWFCVYVNRELNFAECIDDFWRESTIGSKISCKSFFQGYLFKQIDTPLVLACDELDVLFGYPEIAQGFLGLLRSCIEEANNRDIWKQLRLVLVYCTENYGLLDINHSPFNVGQSIELTEFTPAQVEELVRRHQLNLVDDLVSQLMAIAGGHPYLIRLLLYHLAQSNSHNSADLQKILRDAPTDAGIYSQHLRRHLGILRENKKLASVFIQIINQPEVVKLDPLIGYQLYSMGLIKWQGNRAIPRCELYSQYFREHLSQYVYE